jgi:tetrahydromethanopterin S-methyltransferase subunit G
MSQLAPTDIERESLDAHVSICALRYESLDMRLTTIESKVEQLTSAITESRNSMNKVIIAATGTIVSSLIGLIITIIMKF